MANKLSTNEIAKGMACPRGLTRWWVAFWTAAPDCSDYSHLPFQVWIDSYRACYKGGYDDKLLAVIDAKNPVKVWEGIRRYFPDCEPLYCKQKHPLWKPSKKPAPGFCAQTLLTFQVKS